MNYPNTQGLQALTIFLKYFYLEISVKRGYSKKQKTLLSYFPTFHIKEEVPVCLKQQ